MPAVIKALAQYRKEMQHGPRRLLHAACRKSSSKLYCKSVCKYSYITFSNFRPYRKSGMACSDSGRHEDGDFNRFCTEGTGTTDPDTSVSGISTNIADINTPQEGLSQARAIFTPFS